MSVLSTITSPTSSVLPNVVAAFSVLAAATGLFAVLDPLEAIPQIGLNYPLQNDRKSMDLAVALTRIYGVRNMTGGLLQLALWWKVKDNIIWRRALGLSMILSLGTPVVDGVMCEVQGRTSGWKHWVFVPIAAALGTGLLIQL